MIEREKLAFNLLERLKRFNPILIGAYAVNAYVPPRFSADCDLVVDKKSSTRMVKILQAHGFKKGLRGIAPHGGEFLRLERKINELKLAFDLLIEAVYDRQSGISFKKEFISKHSQERTVVGKASPIRVTLKVVNPELLFVMKFICCRRSDVRDIFMLAGTKIDVDLIKNILNKHSRNILDKRIKKVKEIVETKTFRDSLQGVFGKIQDKTFTRSKENLLRILKLIETTDNQETT